MRILDVIPITKGIGTETLSYFSGKDVAVGSIVTVPLRKKGVPAIVIASHDIKTLKADIKEADFQLRNIISAHKGTLFLPEFIRTCVLLKNYTGSTTSDVIASLVPKLFIEEYLEHMKSSNLVAEQKDGLLPEKFIFQAKYSERISFYKTYIRQEFAAKSSVFIVAPTIIEIEHIAAEVSKGIEGRVFVFHSGLTKKKQRDTFEELEKSDQPIVIVGTASYLFIPRTDIGTIVVESEGSPHYRQQSRPFLDKRDVAYVYAHVRGLKYIAADQLLRIETLYRAREERYGEIKTLSFHIGSKKTPEVISMKKDEGGNFAVLDQTTIKTLKRGLREQEHIVLFVGRKGLAPITTCQDCGAVHRSPDSGAPLVLYQKKDAAGRKRSVYQCPVTQKIYDTINACQACGSWKLKMLGIGVDTVVKELETVLPKVTPTVIDGTHTKTHASTKKAVEQFFAKKKGVMIATQKVLPYLNNTVSRVVVVSVDTLFSVPSHAIQEKIMRTLLKLDACADEALVIQTRDPEQMVLKEIQKGNVIDFYRSEIRERKQFLYPPFGVLLEIRVTATATTLVKKRKFLTQVLKKFEPMIIVQPSVKRGSMLVRALIKIPEQEWIKKYSSKQPGNMFKDIFPILEALPQTYAVVINPDRI